MPDILSPYNPTPDEYEQDVQNSRRRYQPAPLQGGSTLDNSVRALSGVGDDLAALLQLTPRRGEQIGNYWRRSPLGLGLPPALLQPGTGKDIELRSDTPKDKTANRRAILTQLAGGK